MCCENQDLERKKTRVLAQIDLLKENVNARHQTVVNLGIASFGLLALASFIDFNSYTKLGVCVLLIFDLGILWYDVYSIKNAINNSTKVLNDILGKEYENTIQEIQKQQNLIDQIAGNFPEISAGIFSLIIIFFLVLVCRTTPKNEIKKFEINRCESINHRWNSKRKHFERLEVMRQIHR